MKVNWLELQNKKHVLAWLLVEVCADDVANADGFDSSAIEVELLVNGVSVDLMAAMDFLNSQLDGIGTAARKEGISEMLPQMIELQDVLTRLIGEQPQ